MPLTDLLVGTTANDGFGETLRSGGQKINTNYTFTVTTDTTQTVSGTKTFTADVFLSDKIVHNGDTNTAIRFPAADTVAVETNGSERMRIRDNGVIAINTTANAVYNGIIRVDGRIETHSPQFNMAAASGATDFEWVLRIGNRQLFYVSSATVVANLSAAGVWTDASDARHKENIRPVPYGLNEVLELKPRAYNMRNDKTEQIGFIAQEVQPVLPELVESVHNNTTGEDRYTLSYSQMSAVLVKAIQELKAELDAVKVELAALKGA
jgi:hypothetical protein